MARRFFPAKPTQKVPGNAVSLGVTLTPVAPATAPCDCASNCDVDNVVWLLQPEYTYGPDEGWGAWASWQITALGTQVALSVNSDGSLVWAPEPGPDTFVSLRVPIYYAWQPPEERPAPVKLVAAARGADISGLQWNIERKSNLYGVEIESAGPLLFITIQPIQAAGDVTNGFDDLTLTAHCGGREVGALRLQVWLDGW